MANRTRVEDSLKNYPSLFISLKNAGIRGEIISVDKLQDENIGDIDLRETRTLNLVSYAFFVTGEKEKAFELNHSVLQDHPNNIIALSNKAWFLYKTNKFSEAKIPLQAIDSQEHLNAKLLVARGELAFAYSRFGRRTYTLAVKEYEKVLAEYQNSRIPKMYFCMWSFGLFLLMQRETNHCGMYTERIKELEQKQLEILRSVTKIHPKGDDTIKLYQARCFANIGGILFKQCCVEFTGKDRYFHVRNEPLQAMVEAHKLGHNDVRTLIEIGKYMRYYNEKLPAVISLLTKSIELKKTSKGYRLLALTVKRDLENKECKKQAKRSSGPNDRLIDYMKCPRNPAICLRAYADFPQMKRSLECFEKAVELDTTNIDAYYDFGLAYRQIGEHEMALEKFESIKKVQRFTSQLLQVANAYEQSGFCISDMISAGMIPYTERDRYNCKMYSVFKKSVELSCIFLRLVPSLDRLWRTSPTMKLLLEGKVHTSYAVGELLLLLERLKSQSSLKILHQLKTIDTKIHENDRRVRRMIKEWVSTGNYDDANLAMNLIACLPNGFEFLKDSLCRKAYIRGGLEAYACGEVLLSRLRIGNVLGLLTNKSQVPSTELLYELLEDDNTHLQEVEVVLIYQNDSTKYAVDALLTILHAVGVKMKVYPPSSTISSKADRTHRRYYIALVDGNVSSSTVGNFNTNVDFILKDLKKRSTRSNLAVVKLKEDADVPEQLSDFESVVFMAERANQSGHFPREILEFFASLLENIANV